MNWTEAAIQKALTHRHTGVVSYLDYICVPNVASGRIVMTGEADLVAISQKGIAKEFEIKTSVSDLKRDHKKEKHIFWDHDRNLISELWYAMPEEVANAVILADHIPPYAGVVVIGTHPMYGTKCTITRKAVRKPNPIHLPPVEILSLARLGCVRFWTRWTNDNPQGATP